MQDATNAQSAMRESAQTMRQTTSTGNAQTSMHGSRKRKLSLTFDRASIGMAENVWRESTLELSVTRVAIEYNHRLCRCLWISQKHGVQLMVLNTSPSAEPYASSELTEDHATVVNYFAAKHDGRRAATYRRQSQQDARPENTPLSNNVAEGNSEAVV
ncbi:hypothetical protein V1517DRAFT_336168 [Lipomyces orientalis]|uniref:Uncharacterized protein n=1 Tax=Lipomyces orientalis TaxID=1233043 RepID=A0ACC3TV25_9ASCO